MAYREMPPPPHLAGIVSCLWEREVDAKEEQSGARVLPDGCIDILWNDGRLLIAGPDSGPVWSAVRAGATVSGARFRRGAAGAALGLPAGELRDLRVDLADVWGRPGSELAERAGEAERPSDRLALISAALTKRRRGMADPDPVVVAAARMMGRPGIRVERMSRKLAISDRQLRRRFIDAVGYGPKMLDRVLRFQRFLCMASELAAGEESLGRAALDLGYADQAHLTRECRALSGLPPRDLVAGIR
jgi:AraC-like DNA-binding protein